MRSRPPATLWGTIRGEADFPCCGIGFPRIQKTGNCKNPEPIKGRVNWLAGFMDELLRVQVESMSPKNPEERRFGRCTLPRRLPRRRDHRNARGIQAGRSLGAANSHVYQRHNLSKSTKARPKSGWLPMNSKPTVFRLQQIQPILLPRLFRLPIPSTSIRLFLISLS